MKLFETRVHSLSGSNLLCIGKQDARPSTNDQLSDT